MVTAHGISDSPTKGFPLVGVLLVGVSLCCPAVDPPSALMTDADIGLGKTVSTERELQVRHVIVM